jgi:outer membrane protein OmpA-like peptidoglycan-associated protein
MTVSNIRTLVVGSWLGALLTPMLATQAPAQVLDRLKKVVSSAAESEAMSQIDRMVRGKVRCVFDDLECIRGAEASGKGAVLTDDSGGLILDKDGKPVSNPEQGAAIATGQTATLRPGQGAWANYDFQPGERILHLDDFTGDQIGDFPRRLELIEGNFELVEWKGGRYLQATSGGMIAIVLPEKLPERFTVEFGASVQHGNGYLRMMPGRAFIGRSRTYKGTSISIGRSQAGYLPVGDGGPRVLTGIDHKLVSEAVAPIRVMADGNHMKMYLGERRVANAPNAVFPRGDTLFVAVGSASAEAPVLLGPIRIAAGGRDLYDRLARDGRVATQGILFASNSDRIRPESTPTLDEIATMLTQHADLRIAIEGHTDSDGEAAFNLDLSQRRAAAVRAYLVNDRGIDGTRLESAGFGESKPAAVNTTPEGKQQNRRVELVRLGK